MPHIRCALLAALVFSAPLAAHDHAGPAMTDAAQQFLAALSPAQRATAVHPFNDQERENWHYVPRSRRGVPLRTLTGRQHALALALPRSVLSTRGAAEADAIIALEQVLRDLEGSSRRDPGLYFVTLFGDPGRVPWAWRFEGHHLSLNVTVVDERHTVVTPTFFGANPAHVGTGPLRGQRTLAAEEDIARQLVVSLDAEQRDAAIIAPQAPREIVTRNDPQVEPLRPAGLSAARLTPEQRNRLEALLQVYLGRYRNEISEALRQRFAADLDQIHFAWAGGLEPGEGHYYRLQGAAFLIEYDNTQNGANHIHTTFRDFSRDFGRDLLREHYEQSHR